MEFQEVAVLIPGLSVFIGAVVQMAKQWGLKSKYAGLAAVLLGVLIGVVYALETGESWVLGVIGGFLAGATPAGVYSGAKALRKKDPLEEDPMSPKN